MKRKTFILSCFLTCSLFLPLGSFASTSKATANFLTQLNGYYYNLSREGLKKYHLEMTPSLSPATIEKLKSGRAYDAALWNGVKNYRLVVDDAAGQALNLNGIPGPKTGDPAVEARVALLENALLDSVKAFFQFWKGVTLEPLNDPRDIEQGDLKFIKEANGFKVTQSDPAGGGITGEFDMKGKMILLTTDMNGGKTQAQPLFVYSQKGYLLQGVVFTGPGVSQGCKIEYGLVDKYWMPKILTLGIQVPGVSMDAIEIRLDLEKVRANQ